MIILYNKKMENGKINIKKKGGVWISPNYIRILQLKIYN